MTRIAHVIAAAACVSLITHAPALRAQSPTSLPADADAAQDVQRLREAWPAGRYHIAPGDVVEFDFPFVSEFNQTVMVQPDGYIALRGVRDLAVAGHTVDEVKENVTEAYAEILRDPVVTVVMKDFEKPYFIVAGEVVKPGRYDLHGGTTLTQALAIAGGTGPGAKRSAVVLFRHDGPEVEAKEIDVKKVLASRHLSEDPILRAGDMLFVPKTRLSTIRPWIPVPGVGIYRPF